MSDAMAHDGLAEPRTLEKSFPERFRELSAGEKLAWLRQAQEWAYTSGGWAFRPYNEWKHGHGSS